MCRDLNFLHIIGSDVAFISNETKTIKLTSKDKINKYLKEIDDYGTSKSKITHNDGVIIRNINTDLEITEKSECNVIKEFYLLKDRTEIPELKDWFIDLENLLIKYCIFNLTIYIENNKIHVLDIGSVKVNRIKNFFNELDNSYGKFNKEIKDDTYYIDLLHQNIYINKNTSK